jgi:formate hydrogenlyase subunit 6/NADH:ubiquinone oxidoreductase subunit I
MKNIPILFKSKELCCGCEACENICPAKAICMKMDNEGFFYPVIDVEKCLRCFKCVSVCPIKED